MKGKWLTLGLCLFLLVGLASTGLAAEKHGGNLIIGMNGDPAGFDPHVTTAHTSYEVLENVYNTLVQAEIDGVEPSLAKSWQVSDDGLTWTFHLREGVKFHNGNPLTAQDVKYSYERILDPDTGCGDAWRLSAVKEIRAPDETTVVIDLEHPYPELPVHLGGFKGMAIVSKENVESGNINKHPIGTGPFEFVEYTPGKEVVIEKNPNYWKEDRPYLDKITYRIIPEESARISSLVTGEIDIIDSVPPQRVDSLKDRKNIEVGETNSNAYWYIGVNLAHKPFNNKAVRQAIAYAINHEDVAAAAKWEAATGTDHPVPESSKWYNDYHPYIGKGGTEKAKEMLEEAGYSDGFKANIMVSTAYPGTIRAAEVIQSQLLPLGIELEIRTLEWGTWLAEQKEGNFDLYICGWLGNRTISSYFHSQHHSEGKFNFTNYSNPELDKLLEEGTKETEFEKRFEIYSQVQKIVIDDAPYIYLYIPKVVNAWRSYVKGYDVRPDQAVQFVDTWLDK